MKISIQGSGSSNYLKAEHTNEEKQEQEEQIEESQKEDDKLQEEINSSAQEVLEEVQKLFGDEPLDEDLKGLIIDALSQSLPIASSYNLLLYCKL